MPTQTTTFKCLLISPGDVQAERDAVIAAVERWNVTTGINLNAHVIVVRWEFARPEMGAPPQDVINRQIVDDADFGIAIFWARLGMPTTNHPSGSAEEVERLISKGANVLVYFSDKPVPHSLLKDDQYDRLQKVKEDYQKRGLLATFSSPEKLSENVSLHLTSLISGLLTKERAANQPIPSVGSMTAPKPDIRVRIAAAWVGQGDTEPRLVAEVQNHSPIDFFFSGLSFGIDTGHNLLVARDALYGQHVLATKIEPGNKKTIVIDFSDLENSLSGANLTGTFVTDAIGRQYAADPKDTDDAIANVRTMLAEGKTRRSPQ